MGRPKKVKKEENKPTMSKAPSGKGEIKDEAYFEKLEKEKSNK